MTNPIFETPLYPYARHPDQERTAHHQVIVVGAGPVGLTAAIDLQMQGVDVVLVDDNDRVSWGSRAICFAKRSLEIFDRLGCADPMRDLGVTWKTGKLFLRDRLMHQFDLQPEAGDKHPAFINLQQYHVERILVERLQALGGDLRGRNTVVGVDPRADGVTVALVTPDGPYAMTCDWLIACDGANSPVRGMLGLGFQGRVFQDRFLIADVRMDADFPSERLFWFDPPFNPGQSALLHKQPEGLWRIDLQLGWDADPELEKLPDRVTPRLQAMLGADVRFDYEWISVYTFQCRRMERFRHGRVLFAGDAAHQVSPFGARGANSGFQDVDNLCWKLKLVLDGLADESLIDSYDAERGPAADENIGHSTRATDFITPKSPVSRMFRDVVLDLAGHADFAKALVNSGRLSTPATYDASPLNGEDWRKSGPRALRPGAVALDSPLGEGNQRVWLLDRLRGFGFVISSGNARDAAPLAERIARHFTESAVKPTILAVGDARSAGGLCDSDGIMRRRYGPGEGTIHVVRPDQHVLARGGADRLDELCACVDRLIGRGGSEWRS